MSNHTRQHVTDGVLATPVAVGFASWLAGVSLENWLLILSITYTVLLIVQKLWQMRGGVVIAARFVGTLFAPKAQP